MSLGKILFLSPVGVLFNRTDADSPRNCASGDSCGFTLTTLTRSPYFSWMWAWEVSTPSASPSSTARRPTQKAPLNSSFSSEDLILGRVDHFFPLLVVH